MTAELRPSVEPELEEMMMHPSPSRLSSSVSAFEALEPRRLLATVPSGFIDGAWGGGIASGTAFDFAPDGRAFVLTQTGSVRVVTPSGTLLGTPALTLTVDSFFERGLLGIALDPGFDATAAGADYVYLYYTVPSAQGGPFNRISRFEVTGDIISPASQTVLLNLNPLSAGNHNGGGLHFGPDGMLYLGVGDNAVGSNSQSVGNLLGKMLRLNPDPANPIPTDNPTNFPGVAGTPTGNNRAIWTVGLRNPFTHAFHPVTGRAFINDVGQSSWEEVNDGIAGRNYGWPSTEGPFTPGSFPNFTNPLHAYQRGAGTQFGAAVSGGAFYVSGAPGAFPSQFHEKYFFGDYVNDWIGYIDPANPPGSNAHTNFATGADGVVDLKVGADGSLYYLQRGGALAGLRRISVQDNAPPTVTGAFFQVDGAQAILFGFSESVAGTASASDLVLTNLTTGQPIPNDRLLFNISADGQTGTWTYNTALHGPLPDGNYNATLPAGSVGDVSGNLLAADVTHAFFFQGADGNRDRSVDLADFAILRANFGGSGRVFTQGDFDYDTDVDLGDFAILRSKFGQFLAPPDGGGLFGDGGGSDDDEGGNDILK